MLGTQRRQSSASPKARKLLEGLGGTREMGPPYLQCKGGKLGLQAAEGGTRTELSSMPLGAWCYAWLINSISVCLGGKEKEPLLLRKDT